MKFSGLQRATIPTGGRRVNSRGGAAGFYIYLKQSWILMALHWGRLFYQPGFRSLTLCHTLSPSLSFLWQNPGRIINTWHENVETGLLWQQRAEKWCVKGKGKWQQRKGETERETWEREGAGINVWEGNYVSVGLWYLQCFLNTSQKRRVGFTLRISERRASEKYRHHDGTQGKTNVWK